MTATATFTPSEAQVKLLTDMVNERIASDAEKANWLGWFNKEIHSHGRYQDAMNALRKLPKLPEFAAATEEGLYRDPATGELYRVTRKGWDRTVSKYSKSAARRIIDATGEEVKKGTWKKFNAFASRQLLSDRTNGPTILASWKMSHQDMVEYRYGICLFCMRGLEDARSVRHNYGPVCAKSQGLPWND